MNLNPMLKIDSFFEMVEEQIKQPTDFFNWDKEKDKVKSKTLMIDIIKNLKEKNEFKIILLDSQIYQPFVYIIKNIKIKLLEENINYEEISPIENFNADYKK